MPVAIFYIEMRWISFAFSTVSTKTSGYKIVCQANYPAKTNLARSHHIALFLYIYINMFLYLKNGVCNKFLTLGVSKNRKSTLSSSAFMLYITCTRLQTLHKIHIAISDIKMRVTVLRQKNHSSSCWCTTSQFFGRLCNVLMITWISLSLCMIFINKYR